MEPEPLSNIINALAWPTAIAVILIVLRRQVAHLATALSGRVSSIKFGEFQIELAPAELEPMSPDWTVDGQDAYGLSAVEIFDSHSASLFQQIAEDSSADYMVVDLQGGEAWLTSRLFFFATVLGEARNVRAFVFVANRDLGSGGFVGFATHEAIHRALAQKYPRLANALMESMRDPFAAQNPNNPDEPEKHIRLETASAEDLRRITYDFVRKVQRSVPPLEEDRDDWVRFDPTNPTAPDIYEYAHWITPSSLSGLLGNGLNDQHITVSPDTSDNALQAMILRRSGDVVALVDEGRRFSKLLDRRAVLEKIAPDVAGQIEG